MEESGIFGYKSVLSDKAGNEFEILFKLQEVVTLVELATFGITMVRHA